MWVVTSFKLFCRNWFLGCRRTIFRRGRECYGEAYIMFSGTADQRGEERSGDRFIKYVSLTEKTTSELIRIAHLTGLIE